MILRGITVSVNYADLLALSLDRWVAGLDELLVVTSTADKQTQELCRKAGVYYFATDIFYANDAKFNKGAALSQAIKKTRLFESSVFEDNWFCIFDADIVPPIDWREQVNRADLQAGNLYGAERYYTLDKTKLTPDPAHLLTRYEWIVLGYFMIGNVLDPRLPDPPFELCWPHAGYVDSVFASNWPRDKQILLPIQLTHLGLQEENWLGRTPEDVAKCKKGCKLGHPKWMKYKIKPPQI